MPDSYELHLRQIERAKMADQATKPSDQSVVHTPGPWEPVRSLTCGHLRAAHNYQVDPKEEWTDADLRLISSAPELLAACKAALEEVQHFSHGTAKQLADAVSKAIE